MVFKDSGFISKDKPELDFILHKWNKRVVQDNRLILGKAIDSFRFDPENKPFTHERFYAWAQTDGVPTRLEDAAEGTGGASGKQSLAGNRLVLILAAAVVLIILAAFFIRGCDSSLSLGWINDNSRGADGSEQEADGKAGEYSETNAPVETVTMEKAEADLDRTVSISGLPREALTIYFEPDVFNQLTAAEDMKVTTLISALKLFEEGSMTVTGHAAAIGYPEGERNVSESRARFIAERLRSAGVSGAITLRTTGEGSLRMVSNSNIETARRLSRRIEITVP